MIKIVTKHNNNFLKQIYDKFIYAVSQIQSSKPINYALDIDNTFALKNYQNFIENTLNKKTINKNLTKELQAILYKLPIYTDLAKLISLLEDKPRPKKIFEKLGRKFDWNRFRNKTSTKKLINDLISKLGLKICPYCNINPIPSLICQNNTIINPSIDHFYNKSKYNYLATSLYNLIPSCDFCNSKFKLAKNTFENPILNPYFEGFEDNVRFECKMDIQKNQISSIYLAIKKDICDEIYVKKCQATNITLHITDLYNSSQKELAAEIQKKCKLYLNKTYFKNMNKLLRNSDFTLEELVFGNYLKGKENDLKESGSKFKRDLFYFFTNRNENYIPLESSPILNK